MVASGPISGYRVFLSIVGGGKVRDFVYIQLLARGQIAKATLINSLPASVSLAMAALFKMDSYEVLYLWERLWGKPVGKLWDTCGEPVGTVGQPGKNS